MEWGISCLRCETPIIGGGRPPPPSPAQGPPSTSGETDLVGRVLFCVSLLISQRSTSSQVTFELSSSNTTMMSCLQLARSENLNNLALVCTRLPSPRRSLPQLLRCAAEM